MPFDGFVLRAVNNELNSILSGGRIEKISQPCRDEVFFSIYSKGNKYKLLISSNASYPRVHLTSTEPENPLVPFNFCILLRKYLAGYKITEIFQPGLERILEIKCEGTDEIGDSATRFLIVEIMGKHSNIILLNQNRKIIDSIKHIDTGTSRIREILPGRDYMYPNTQSKSSIFDPSSDYKIRNVFLSEDNNSIGGLIVETFSGFSPFLAREYSSEVFSNKTNGDFDAAASNVMHEILQIIDSDKFTPYIILDKNKNPLDFHCLFHSHFGADSVKTYCGISEALNDFYNLKSVHNKITAIRSELLKSVANKLEKCLKKIQIQTKNISDSEEKDKFKLFGELINSNLYRIEEGIKEISVVNYYDVDCKEIVIPLNPNIPPSKNAQAYFKKYLKAKKTCEAANIQLSQLEKEKYYLESLVFQLEESNNIHELNEIRNELVSEGIISDFIKNKKSAVFSAPIEYLSSDGFTILVGKNNRQNDHLTFKTAARTDIWLHTRNIPGSHVVIKTEKKDVPETTLVEACILAAYHSKSKNSTHVPVDYTEVKHVKKPGGAKPGFVIYENFKTLTIDPQISIIEKLKKT